MNAIYIYTLYCSIQSKLIDTNTYSL